MNINCNQILIIVLILLVFSKHLNEKFGNYELKEYSSCGCGTQIKCEEVSLSSCQYTLGCKLNQYGNSCVYDN